MKRLKGLEKWEKIILATGWLVVGATVAYGVWWGYRAAAAWEAYSQTQVPR